MGATGTATLDFGAFPGSADTSAAVTGQAAIAGSSLTEAWIMPATTTDHSADEHVVEMMEVKGGAATAGVGFTIYGISQSPSDSMIYGQWNVGWVWN